MADRRMSRRTPSLPPLPNTHLDGATPLPKGRYPIPENVQPTNFIQISQVNSVRGVYTIDPGLSPPTSLRVQSLGSGRQNMLMESQQGSINVNLFVLPSSDKQTTVNMTLKSQTESARVRVHDAESQGVSYIRGPLNIVVSAVDKADIYIPRSFRGSLHMTTNAETGRVWYSRAVRSMVAPVYSVNGTHNSFVGRLPLDGDSGNNEPSDKLTVNVTGLINIYYDDEGSIPTRDTASNVTCIILIFFLFLVERVYNILM